MDNLQDERIGKDFKIYSFFFYKKLMRDFGIDVDKWTEEIEHENERDEAEVLAQHKDQDWYVQ